MDFVRVRRDVAVSADVPLNAEGEPPGAKEGGILEQLLGNVGRVGGAGGPGGPGAPPR